PARPRAPRGHGTAGGDEREPLRPTTGRELRRAPRKLRRAGRRLPLSGGPDDRSRVNRARPCARRGDDPPRGFAYPRDARRAPARRALVVRLAPFRMSEILVVCTGNVCRSPMAEGFLCA